MRLSIQGRLAAVAAVAMATSVGGRPVHAQGDDPAGSDEPARESAPREGIEGGGFDDYETAEEKQKTEVRAEYGIGLRFRTVYVPKAVFELVVEEASSGILRPGFGLELARRKENFELVIGLEYENVSPDNGYWLDKGDDPNVAGETPDYLEFDGLAWISADVAVRFSAPLNDKLAFRYGAGLGLGVVLGDVLQTDTTCAAGTDDLDEDCMPDQVATEGRQLAEPADLPPVFPVVELLVGLQWRPVEKLTFNFDTGIRTAPFFGLSSTLYF
ncbi:MAG TPA: hypothetical protein VK698_36225 [Kofleriaceae bacterium]|nr:hypothetical protein [Kofleriaceae bacterium]